jgi:hypothetical protein
MRNKRVSVPAKAICPFPGVLPAGRTYGRVPELLSGADPDRTPLLWDTTPAPGLGRRYLVLFYSGRSSVDVDEAELAAYMRASGTE